jgi:hypothetical protein
MILAPSRPLERPLLGEPGQRGSSADMYVEARLIARHKDFHGDFPPCTSFSVESTAYALVRGGEFAHKVWLRFGSVPPRVRGLIVVSA